MPLQTPKKTVTSEPDHHPYLAWVWDFVLILFPRASINSNSRSAAETASELIWCFRFWTLLGLKEVVDSPVRGQNLEMILKNQIYFLYF